MIRGGRKPVIEELDTPAIQELIVGADRGNTDQIGPRVVIFDADDVPAHTISHFSRFEMRTAAPIYRRGAMIIRLRE